jgi:hypothetical protein
MHGFLLAAPGNVARHHGRYAERNAGPPTLGRIVIAGRAIAPLAAVPRMTISNQRDTR